MFLSDSLDIRKNFMMGERPVLTVCALDLRSSLHTLPSKISEDRLLVGTSFFK